MKIRIESKNEKNISLTLPNFMAKSILAKLIKKYTGIAASRQQLKQIFSAVKRYKRTNGEFALMEIESEEEKVKILL